MPNLMPFALPVFWMLYLISVLLGINSEYTQPVPLSLILILLMIDNLLNAMVNALYILVCGALSGRLQSRVVLFWSQDYWYLIFTLAEDSDKYSE